MEAKFTIKNISDTVFPNTGAYNLATLTDDELQLHLEALGSARAILGAREDRAHRAREALAKLHAARGTK